jgi:hypothetical protein
MTLRAGLNYILWYTKGWAWKLDSIGWDMIGYVVVLDAYGQ